MLNTLTIAQNLAESGFKREQAEAIANVVADAAKSERGDLASKEFVSSQISGLETRLIRWIVGTGIAVGAPVTAVAAIVVSVVL